MNDGLFCGLALGMIAGVLLYKHCPDAKELVNNTENAVKKEVSNLKK